MTRTHTARISHLARLGRPLPLRQLVSFAAAGRAAAMAAVLFSLSACWGLSGESRSPGGEQVMQSNLSVASAALAAGQPAVAQKLYLALAERFGDAPEPVLGLGYIALRSDSPGEAGDYFKKAAKLSVDAPGLRAEALLGAARASLAQGDSAAARRHLSVARDLAEDSSTIAWIENGLAVAAVLEEDYGTAEIHYASALRQPSAHPRIAANFIRMLVATDRIDEAERAYGAHAASYWEESDRQALNSLIDGARRLPPPPVRPDPRLLLRLTGVEVLPTLADDAAYPAEGGLRRGLEGPVLIVGDLLFPAVPVAADTQPAAAAATVSIPPESPAPHKDDTVPTSAGSGPASQLSVRDVEPMGVAIPSLATALAQEAPHFSVERTGAYSQSDVLVLRIDPWHASPEGTGGIDVPGDDTPAEDPRSGTPVDERLLLHTRPDTVPVESLPLGKDSLRSGLVLALARARFSALSETAAPALGSATGLLGTARENHDSGPVWTSDLSLATVGGRERVHQLETGPAPSKNALLLTVPSRNVPSLSEVPQLRTSSSRDSRAHESGVLIAAPAGMPEDSPEVARTHVSDPQSSAIEDEDRTHRSEPGPTLVVNVAILNDYSNYDPFSAATGPYRPFMLASAASQSDHALWDSVWRPQGGATNLRTLTLAASKGHDDWLSQFAEAVPSEREASDEWTVLLGTGQRLSLGVDAAAVAIASPDIADVQLLTPRVLFVMGRKLGRTTVSVLGEDGSVFERDVSVVLDIEPLRALLAGEPGLRGVQVEGLARGVALAGSVDSQEAADRALGLVAASLPEGTLVENNLDVGLDLGPLRTLLAGELGLEAVQVRRIGRVVALTGEVASAENVDRAQRLAVASLPEGMPVENDLSVALDLEPLRTIMVGEPGLAAVEVRRVGRGVALTGEVVSAEAADRAHRLAVASLPHSMLVENNLRVVFDIEPLRTVLSLEPGLDRVQVRRLARGVALAGEVDSPEASDRALRLAAASLPEDLLVENNLSLHLDLLPLRALLVAETGLGDVRVQQVGRGVALAGKVASAQAADQAYRLAVGSLPEGVPVANDVEAVDLESLRAVLAGEDGLQGVRVESLPREVALVGEVVSPALVDLAGRLAAGSLPEGVPVRNDLRAVDLEPLRAVLAGEAGLQGVRVERLTREVALVGEVASEIAVDRADTLAADALPQGVMARNDLRVVDLGPLRAALAGEAGLQGVRVERQEHHVALVGEVASESLVELAAGLAAESLPESVQMENGLRVVDLEPLRAALAGEAGLQGVRAERQAHEVVLVGEVASESLAELAAGLAAGFLPESVPVENSLRLVNLEPLRAVLAGEAGMQGVRVERQAHEVALVGEVASESLVELAAGLAADTLPQGMPVANEVKQVDLEPLRVVLAGEAGLEGVRAESLPREVMLVGEVASPALVVLAGRLAEDSLPESMPVVNDLQVVDLAPLRALLAGEPGLAGVEVRRVGRGVALTGEVASAEAADRAHRLAVVSLPDSLPVENNLRVEFDVVPLRVLLAGEAGLERIEVQRLDRGVVLTGYVDSPAAADRALGLASASLPEGLLVQNNLTVGLGLAPLRAFLAGETGLDDLSPLRAFIAGEPGLEGVEVQRVGRGVALTGEVASAEAAGRARRLAVAALPEAIPVENNLRVVFDVVPLRVLLAGETGLERVQVQRLARGVALSGYVDSPAAEDRALRLAAASLPEGLLVENNLDVGLDLGPLRALMAGESGLKSVEVRRVGRGVALTGEVASAESADRAHRLAVASLPDNLPVENNLRVVFDVEPLRTVLAAEPGLESIHVRQLARGVALSGDVASPEAADRAWRLAAASLPEGLVVENNLDVGLDLEPLRTLLGGEPGLEGVEVQRVGRGVALTGEVASAEAADRAHRLAVASLPERLLIENNLRVEFDIEPLRAILGLEPGLEDIRVQRLARGVALAGDVASPEASDRARRLAAASLPEGLLVENNLSVVLDLEPLRSLLEGEPGLEGVEVQRVARGIALTGEVASGEAADRALRLATASLPENLPVENNLRVMLDLEPLRTVLAGEADLDSIQALELAGGIVLTGDVVSAEASDRAQRLAAASLPDGVPVENSLRVVPDIEPLRAALAGEPGLDRVQVQRLARGVALSGDVDSPAEENRALRLAAASLPEGVSVENNLNVGLDLAPLRSFVAGEPGLMGVRVQRTGRGVALIGEVGSAEAADQASRLAAALLPEDVPVDNSLRVVWDIGPLRTLLAGSPDLEGVQVQRLARGVVLGGEVASHAASDLAFRLATASLPEGVLIENNLNVQLDLAPLRVLIADEPDLRRVRVKRTGRGVALSGEVGSVDASERAHRLAVVSLPEGVAVENGLRVAPDVGPLRTLLAREPGLERVQVTKLARGVALAGDVPSPRAADVALRLAAASLPEGMLVENNLSVGLDLGPLEALLVAEEGFGGVRLNRIDRGVALTGEVGSQTESERAGRLAAASLPEGALVENNLRLVLNSGPLRAALAADPEFDGVHVRDLEHGVSLSGEVSSAAAAARAHRLAAVSLPENTPVENNLRIAGPLQVNLEVQIAEVQRSIAEEFGFNWELFGRSAEGDLGGSFRIGRRDTAQQVVVDGLPSPSLVLSRTWEEIGITGMVDALAKAGLANVLARPNVTANSGETASFFSGGEFPLPSGFKDGVIVFEYKKYGVVLDFVPTIVDDGRVELTVRPEVSEPSQDNSVQVAGGVTVPVINVRRAETTVEMGDGESIVIAGLFSSASNEVQSGVPVLKDLPLLGAMFGHTSTRADELELIVTVTARLVQAGPAPGEAVTAGSGQTSNSYYY